MQGSVSQNFDLGPSFYFMKCRKTYFENILKIYQKKLKKSHTKCQARIFRGYRDILVQKIKVEKSVKNSQFS